MSEGRMDRIEALLERLTREVTTLRAEMATKNDLVALRAETKDELVALRAAMATKQELAGVAKNVDVTAIGRQMHELLAMKDDVTVLTAIVQRLDNTMVRQVGDVLTEVRAEHSRMDRLLARVRALEQALPLEDG